MKNFEQKAEGTQVSSAKKHKNDLIFISALLLIILIAALAMLLFRTEGDKVVVSVDSQVFGEYSLGESQTVEIKNGDGYNVLVIENGEARVESASCPDGICSSHRPISYNGQSIICLPNNVVIEVHTTDDSHPDIIN